MVGLVLPAEERSAKKYDFDIKMTSITLDWHGISGLVGQSRRKT
jgi:hypothetical protein